MTEYSDIFVRLAGNVTQCAACLLSRPFIDFATSIKNGWTWVLEWRPAGHRLRWTCGDCNGREPERQAER